MQFASKVFEDLNVTYAVVGSMASSYFGDARMTNDVDIVADLRSDQVDAFVAQFPEQDFYVSDQAVRDAIKARSQFNIIHPDSGLKLDVMIPSAGEHSEVELRRRVRVKPVGGDAETFLAAPEDIIIKKMEFYREGGSQKHLRDIAGMLKVSGQLIDRSYVQEWSEKLGLSEIWEQILARTAPF
jgi:hypothetical protein